MQNGQSDVKVFPSGPLDDNAERTFYFPDQWDAAKVEA